MWRQVHPGLPFPNSSSFSLKSMSFHNFLLFKNLQYLVINLRIKTKIYNRVIIISSFLSRKFHNSLSLEKPFLHSWIRLDFCCFHNSLLFLSKHFRNLTFVYLTLVHVCVYVHVHAHVGDHLINLPSKL